MLELLTIVIAAIGALFKGMAFVEEGELGIRLRFGRAVCGSDGTPLVIQPGFVWTIPFVDKLVRHHVREQTVNLYSQKLMSRDKLVFKVDSVVLFKVGDVYKALFEVDDLSEGIENLAQGVLRGVLCDEGSDNLIDIERISKKLTKRLQERVANWGVKILQFSLTDCSPSVSAESVISLPAMIKRRIDACETHGVNPLTQPFVAAVLMGTQMVTPLPIGDDGVKSPVTAEADNV